MRVRMASEAAPDHAGNEDRVFTRGNVVGVLDGVSEPPGLESGCIHNVSWYVDRLTANLTVAVDDQPDAPLPDLLARAIAGTNTAHGGACDLAHPGTPAATICLIRAGDTHLEYLILCDALLVIDDGQEISVFTDTRIEQAVAGIRREYPDGRTLIDSPEHAERFAEAVREKQRFTNTEAGYWIAAANPDAAHHALTGTLPLTGARAVHRAALLTDGATRAVDTFDLMDWRELLDLADREGPEALIKRVRDAENADPGGVARPRFKRYDDATAAICHFTLEEP
jgi:hypothetical protein